jgi:hypothetical protein
MREAAQNSVLDRIREAFETGIIRNEGEEPEFFRKELNSKNYAQSIKN